MSNKDKIVVKVGSGVISTIAALYLVPEPTWSKILAGLLTIVASSIAYVEGKALYNAYKDAQLYYGRITY